MPFYKMYNISLRDSTLFPIFYYKTWSNNFGFMYVIYCFHTNTSWPLFVRIYEKNYEFRKNIILIRYDLKHLYLLNM